MAFFQYLRDTRGELHHVAWPTRVQTIIYTILVVVLSIVISLYLGFFDFVFTSGLGRVVEMLPGAQTTPTEQQLDLTQISTTSEPIEIE